MIMCMTHQKEFGASCAGMTIIKNLWHTQKCLIANHTGISVKYLYYSEAIITIRGNFHLHVLSPSVALKNTERRGKFSAVFQKPGLGPFLNPSWSARSRLDLPLDVKVYHAKFGCASSCRDQTHKEQTNILSHSSHQNVTKNVCLLVRCAYPWRTSERNPISAGELSWSSEITV